MKLPKCKNSPIENWSIKEIHFKREFSEFIPRYALKDMYIQDNRNFSQFQREVFGRIRWNICKQQEN